MRLIRLSSKDELLKYQDRWDDLWLRSEVAYPRARAGLIANWLDHFGRGLGFRALVVESQGRFVASLPLVSRRIKGFLPVLGLPESDWASCGDLLLDRSEPIEEVLESLVSGLRRERPALLWLNQVALESDRWLAFLEAADAAGFQSALRTHYEIGQVMIAHDWEAYEKQLDGKHRRNRKRNARMLAEVGDCRFQTYRQFSANELEKLFQRGFEVEDRSWKGAEGTSVLRSPNALEFLRTEAKLLAEDEQLELNFLDLDGRPIAFEYGFRAKGVHFLPKIGCDEAFAKYGPGQQLTMLILQALNEDPEIQQFDFAGPLVEWSRPWANQSYPMGRIVVSLTRGLDRLAVKAYDQWLPAIRRGIRAWRQPKLSKA